jgi:SOS-response transcriptional repressor LexA
MIKEIGQRIRHARQRASMTQHTLGNFCGVSRAAVAQWENGTTHPSLKHLQLAADAMGVWVSQLTGEEDASDTTPNNQPAPRGWPVPVIDYVTAGSWGTINDPYPPGRGMDVLITEQKVGADTFALAVHGNSMEDTFHDGDKIIVDPDVSPQPGDFVVAKLDDLAEATFKKYRPRGTDAEGQPMIDLVPLNEDWPVLKIDSRNPGRIIGTVIEYRGYRQHSRDV